MTTGGGGQKSWTRSLQHLWMNPKSQLFQSLDEYLVSKLLSKLVKITIILCGSLPLNNHYKWNSGCAICKASITKKNVYLEGVKVSLVK